MTLSLTSSTGTSSNLASQHVENTHIATPLTGTGPASSPPSSSPVAVTPPDDAEEEIDLKNGCYDSPFLRRLDDLLLAAVQEKQDATGDLTESSNDSNDSTGTLEFSRTSGSETATTLDCPVNLSRKRTRWSPAHVDGAPGSVYKKRKLSKAQPRIITRASRQNPSASLSGAFRLQYARRPGSLRRAESLRSQLSVDEEEQVLNEVLDENGTERSQPSSVPYDLPIVGNVASPFGGYAPTVPTTPTANDVQGQVASVSDQEPLVADIPVIPVPPFELIPKPPRTAEEAAERRIAALLSRELDERTIDGLHCASTPRTSTRRTEDEEERFWLNDIGCSPPSCDVDDPVLWANMVAPSPTTRANPEGRAQIHPSPIRLDLDADLQEQVIDWILEAMPSDDHKTFYSPGDLYDLLSSSAETRFHAAYLFMRYHMQVRSGSSASSANAATQPPEEQEALEAVTWDVAVACLALSVKFHRDVLFPLDVIYVEEFLDLAPHEMDFEDLESAQRDVLEAIAYRVGSATPGAFIEELRDALPTLRRLVCFEDGWDAVQEEAWEILKDALQQPELLQYPPSLMTGAAVIEGVIVVLQRRYKATGVDGRGRPVAKRDARSLRKIAVKCSRGVRLDIQDILQITNEALLECQQWLGLTTG